MPYKIISTIKFNTEIIPWEEWKLFQSNVQLFYDLCISIELQSHIKYGIEVLNEQPGKPVLKYKNCLLSVNDIWSYAKITIFDDSLHGLPMILNALLMSHLSVHDVLLLHASLITVKKRGIMFLGASGIGKTTQAELWMEYRGADIINGDMVYVKKEKDYFLGCGSPWHGSSPYCLNRQVPLAALIVLKQNQENSIRRLNGFEMVSAVMNSVFFPTWYEKGHEEVCQTLDSLLKNVPVYELSCRPDEDAVRLTEETIFGKSVI